MLSKLKKLELFDRIMKGAATEGDVSICIKDMENIFNNAPYRLRREIVQMTTGYPEWIPVITYLLPNLECSIADLVVYYDVSHASMNEEQRDAFHDVLIYHINHEISLGFKTDFNLYFKKSMCSWELKDEINIEEWIDNCNISDMPKERRYQWMTYPRFKEHMLQSGGLDALIFLSDLHEKNMFLANITDSYDITSLYHNYGEEIVGTDFLENTKQVLKKHQDEITKAYYEHYILQNSEYLKQIGIHADDLPYIFDEHNIEMYGIHEWSETNKIQLFLIDNTFSVFKFLKLFPEKREEFELWYEDNSEKDSIEFLLPYREYEHRYKEYLREYNATLQSLDVPILEYTHENKCRFIVDNLGLIPSIQEEHIHI